MPLFTGAGATHFTMMFKKDVEYYITVDAGTEHGFNETLKKDTITIPTQTHGRGHSIFTQ